MTADEQALLAAVVAAPDSDLPRLVYADWCDDHGRPGRAEYIRVQCGFAAALTSPARRADREPLRRRLRHLRRAHGRACHAALPAHPFVEWGGHVRGFPEQVEVFVGLIPPADLAGLTAGVPVTTLVAHCYETAQLRDLLGSALLGRLRTLSLNGPHRLHPDAADVGEAAALLAGHDWPPGLGHLYLNLSGLTDGVAATLAAVPAGRPFPALLLPTGCRFAGDSLALLSARHEVRFFR